MDYNSTMAVSRTDLQRWIAGFEAADEADREARRAQGPRPEWSIMLSLSLLDAAKSDAGGRYPFDPHRRANEEAVRAVWTRLRERLR